MFDFLTQLLGGESGTVVVECRRCGSNRADGSSPCPDCGNDTVASYSL